MIKAILFDCYGVVVGMGIWSIYRDAGGDDIEYLNSLLVELNSGRKPSSEYHRELSKHLSMDFDEWKKFHDDSEQPNEDVIAYIHELKKNYKVGLLSNANSGSVENRLRGHIEIFDDIVISADVGVQKPDPEIYYLAARRLNVMPEECVFVDDNQPYLVGADAVGMKTILFESTQQFKQELVAMLGPL